MSKDISFEDSIFRLEEIVGQLEGGKMDLQTSLRQYEEGISLLRNCQSILENARQKIEIIKNWDANGSPITAEADLEDFQSNKAVPGKKISSGQKVERDDPDEILEKHTPEEIALYSR